MNLSNNEFETVGYADSIRKFQDMGHLLMDHTPSHATNYFITLFDTSQYSNLSGVNHIVDQKICLSHEEIDTTISIFNGIADIDGHKIFFNSSDYHILTHYSELNKDGRYFYFPSLDTLLLAHNFNNSGKYGDFYDIWAEQKNLPPIDSLKFFTFTRDQITITNDAYSLLIAETKKLCDSLYNLTPPNIWIQPGGQFPVLNSMQVKAPLENLDFIGAATYPNSAEKVYNEYNPNNDRQFAFQWGDFVEDEMTLDVIKGRIADGIAKHKVMINNIHWYSSVGNNQDWLDYLELMDNLLEWADTNSIPIDTYENWITELYDSLQNPYENIIPPLNIDLDSNDIPDGYQNIYWLPTQYTGTWLADSTSPDGYAYSSTYYDNYRRICIIQDMGGIEKGENEFSIWTKGGPDNFIRIIVDFDSESAPQSIEYKIPADTPHWQKYDLSQSLNANKNLIVPTDASLISFDFVHGSQPLSSAAEVRLSGMTMRKKIALDSLSLTLLNGPISAGDSIFIEVELIDEFGDPKVTSYPYSVTFPDTSNATLLSQGQLFFQNTSLDTIVIRDTSSGISSFTANLDNLPSISGQIEIPIIPATPNNIEILTIIDTISIGSQVEYQIALADSFSNRIADSAIVFEALNGNGKFENNLQIDTAFSNYSGIAQLRYTSSSTLNEEIDLIKISYSTTIIDTIIQPLKSAPISQIELTEIGLSPYFDKDTVLVEISAKDIFGNYVINSESYSMQVQGSNSAKIFPSNDFTFNEAALDTISLSDSLDGTFNLIAKLDSDTLVTDTVSLQIEYYAKSVELKINLQGAFDTLTNLMKTSLNSLLPLISPYIEAPDTVTSSIQNDIVDWVLVRLRKEADPLIPNPMTSIIVDSKSALLKNDGMIIDPHTLQNLKFMIPEDWYYIVVNHRNHLSVMSSVKIHLTK